MWRNPYLQLTRPVNLAIVAITQWFVFRFLIQGATATAGLPTTMSRADLMLLITATLCLVASGNVVNDIHDTEVDEINKPAKSFIPSKISSRTAWQYALLLSIAGFCISVFLGMKLSLVRFILIYPAVSLTLWLYSSRLKGLPLIGNVLVALFCAGVILVVAVPDWQVVFSTPNGTSILMFAAFAGLITLYREIVKDLQDMPGDKEAGLRTLPIVAGPTKARILATGTLILLVGAIAHWEFRVIPGMTSFRISYISFAVVIPVLYLVILTVRARSSQEYGTLSTISKLVMVSGSLIVLLI